MIEMMNSIELNYNGTKGSFIYEMHECNKFDIELLNILIHDIVSLIKSESQSINEISEFRNWSSKLFDIYSYFSSSISSHFAPNDLFEIKNLPDDYILYYEQHKNSM